MPSDAFHRLKICQKCVCGLQRSPDPLAGFKGAYFSGKGRRRERGRGGKGRKGKWRGGEREGEDRGGKRREGKGRREV